MIWISNMARNSYLIMCALFIFITKSNAFIHPVYSLLYNDLVPGIEMEINKNNNFVRTNQRKRRESDFIGYNYGPPFFRSDTPSFRYSPPQDPSSDEYSEHPEHPFVYELPYGPPLREVKLAQKPPNMYGPQVPEVNPPRILSYNYGPPVLEAKPEVTESKQPSNGDGLPVAEVKPLQKPSSSYEPPVPEVNSPPYKYSYDYGPPPVSDVKPPQYDPTHAYGPPDPEVKPPIEPPYDYGSEVPEPKPSRQPTSPKDEEPLVPEAKSPLKPSYFYEPPVSEPKVFQQPPNCDRPPVSETKPSQMSRNDCEPPVKEAKESPTQQHPNGYEPSGPERKELQQPLNVIDNPVTEKTSRGDATTEKQAQTGYAANIPYPGEQHLPVLYPKSFRGFDSSNNLVSSKETLNSYGEPIEVDKSTTESSVADSKLQLAPAVPSHKAEHGPNDYISSQVQVQTPYLSPVHSSMLSYDAPFRQFPHTFPFPIYFIPVHPFSAHAFIPQIQHSHAVPTYGRKDIIGV